MIRINQVFKLLANIDTYYNDIVASGEYMPNGRFGMRVRSIMSFIIWGTSFSEYFGYRFWKRSVSEKKTYMTRRHMFKFFDKYNDPAYRERMGDKSLSTMYYGQFMKRKQFLYEQGKDVFDAFCTDHPKIFIKRAIGWGG